jgi:hypothetical protein
MLICAHVIWIVYVEYLLISFSATGLVMSLVVTFMLLSEDYKSTGKVLKYCFEFVPHFTITYAFTRFSYLVLSNNQCRLKKSYCNSISGAADLCCSKFPHYFNYGYEVCNIDC